MSIRVRFFASLREQFANSAQEIDAADIRTVSDVWEKATLTPSLPEHILCSVNLEHREPNTAVNDGDEVAFFPPVTGG